MDADLRPEGKNGPLARSLASYRRLLREVGRAMGVPGAAQGGVAGDHHLGEDFARLAAGIVWLDSLDPAAIRSIRGMKARSEARVLNGGYAATEIKRGFGGIRDAEFAVQLLQLVHGRFDASLRRRATLDALAALAGGGYVREEDATLSTLPTDGCAPWNTGFSCGTCDRPMPCPSRRREERVARPWVTAT